MDWSLVWIVPGDRVIGGQFTIQAMMSMLNKMGINLVVIRFSCSRETSRR